ncbi:translation factor [Guyanagaster necrorhizus]|uniref:Threonylcarbamoyl-AMP synthase n=1 Tax=Guyanagaster necrorhizus TaxID=856835 RepID=A0A9P8AWV6_9AGAR|nr:translation factor [Guyanagaster necrorhizus MCA 3950]KAG7449302.1 translation factor [Guyanagaster necrorhizus MCA 3950]
MSLKIGHRFLRMSATSTKVLKCDSASINFDSASQEPTITSPDTLASLQIAARHLHDLQPVAFPTETVYGLGALALNPTAASRIFTMKGRPSDNPLIVHVSSLKMLRSIIPSNFILPATYQILMRRFWPGALTLLFPSDPNIVPSIITANHPTVAIRMPSHPVARALIAVADVPLAAPSANSSGKPSPTRSEHVLRDHDGRLGIILDGGPCEVGVESTVIDGLQPDGNIRVLRPGGVTVEDMSRVLQQELDGTECIPQVLVYRRDYADQELEQAPTTPGMKYRHYSPSVPVTLLFTHSPAPAGERSYTASEYLATLSPHSEPIKVGLLTPPDSVLGSFALPDGIEWRRFFLGPISSPAVTAQRLFDGLLTLEEEGVDLILIEEIEECKEGLAVMNRVRKAASEFKYLTV